MSRKPNLTGEEYNKVFPQRLREIMRSKNVTQKDLASEIGKTRQAVSYYMDGSSGPDWETIAKIASFLGVSSDYLIGLSDRQESPEIELEYIKRSGLSCTSLVNLSESGELKSAINALLSSDKFDALAHAFYNCLQSYASHTEEESITQLIKEFDPDYGSGEYFFSANREIYEKEGLTADQARRISIEEYKCMTELYKKKTQREKKNKADLAIFTVQRFATKIAEDMVEISKSKYIESQKRK